MIKGLLTTLIMYIAGIGTMFAQGNNFEIQILEQNRDLKIVVVDTKGFLAQNQIAAKNYKERHHRNFEWFKNNWSSFLQSVDEKKSYQVKMTSEKYAALSESQKNKLRQLYDTSFTGLFNPVGIATSQMYSTNYKGKGKGQKKLIYQRAKLTEKHISTYARNKNEIVFVLDTKMASEISSILNH